MQGLDIAAVVVALIMICGPMAAGAKRGMDEGVTRSTPVMVSPASTDAPIAAPPAAAKPPAATAPVATPPDAAPPTSK